MHSIRLSTMLLSGAALAGLGASVANASLVIDIRAVTLNGSTNLGPGNTPKNLPNVMVGDTIGMRVFAEVTGSDASKFQCLQSLAGSFLSGGGGGLIRGTLVLTADGLVQPFNGPGSFAGLATDLDGDGDIDIGSNDHEDPAGFWTIRSPLLAGPHSTSSSGESVFDARFPPTPIPGGWEYTVTNNLLFVMRSVSANPAEVNFRTRRSKTGGLWVENADEVTTDNGDGTTAYGYAGGTNFTDTTFVLSGTPVLIGFGGILPEPAVLGLAALAGLGMLARRRK